MSLAGDPLVTKLRLSSGKAGDEAARLIEENRAFENNATDLASFTLIIGHGFCDDEPVRDRVVEFLESKTLDVPPEFFTSPDVEALFVQEGQIVCWIAKELEQNNATVLRPWAALVKSMQKPIPIKLLNKILSIPKKCFMSPNQTIRAEAYRCWTVLIDNFALDPNILCSKNRIELITIPLCLSVRILPENNCVLRFDVWWHFMGVFKEKLTLFFKNIVMPFLQFYFVPSGIKATMAGQSPAKQYSKINNLALEAMAVLFCGLNSFKISQVNLNTIHSCLSNGQGILSVKTYMDTYQSIFTVLREAINLLGFSKSEVSYMGAIFHKLGTLSMNLYLQVDEDCKTIATEFLKLCVETLSIITTNPNGVTMVLEILDVVSKMPTKVLTSSKLLETPEKECLAVTMIRYMLSTDFSNRITSMTDSERNGFNATFERYSSQLQKCHAGGLAGFHVSATCLIKSNLSTEHLAVLWKTLASNFEKFIERFQEICQENEDGGLDLSTVELLLLFPFAKFLNSSSRQIWNQWTKLFKRVVDTAETLAAYKSLSIEDRLASRVKDISTDKVSPVEHYNLSIHLSESLVASVKSICGGKTRSQNLQVNPPTSVLKLLANLSISTLSLAESKSATLETVYNSLCNQNIIILEVSTRPELMFEVYLVMSQAIAALIDNRILSIFKADQAAGLALFERVINSIQARYEGPFNEELLEVLKPLFLCGLPHEKSKISSRCRELWNVTFAPQLSKVPSEISDCLESSSSLLESSTSTNLSQTTSSPTTFRSFFSRKTHVLETKPTISSSSTITRTQSSVQTLKAIKSTISIEDENSSNFVVISPSSRKKRPLTEHQKEKLLSRNDVPALYSELSQDSAEVGKLLPIFDSQQSLDGSSIAPSQNSFSNDHSENAVQPLDSKENKEVGNGDKWKQTVPHKFVATPKTRTRKRTFDEANKESPKIDRNESSRSKTTKQAKSASQVLSKSLSSATTKSSIESPEIKLLRKISCNIKSMSPADLLKKGIPGNIMNSKVVMKKLEIDNQTPVKIVQEMPLILEPVANSRPIIAKKLAFESQDESDVVKDDQSSEDYKELDFIESSQTIEARPSKRLRMEGSKSNAKSPTLTQSGLQKKKKVNHYGETKLHIAVRRDKPDDVLMHLKNGVPINECDNFGWVPLHQAFSPQPNSFTIMRLLIQNGADVNAQAMDGSTPLHSALCQRASKEVLDFLLESGADPSLKNEAGVSPADTDPQLLDWLKPTTLKTVRGEVVEGNTVTDPVCVEPKPEKEAEDTSKMPSPAPPKTVRTPLPFSKVQSTPTRSPLSHISRGEKMISLSKTKSFESVLPSFSPVTDLMSPKPVVPPVEPEAVTPKQNKPWQRYEPSPMDKMPSVSILKDASNIEKSEEKKGRRVQFTDPIVSDEVEIEKLVSGKSPRQRRAVRRGFIHRTQLKFESSSSIGSDEMSQDLLTPNYIYPSLIECNEPVRYVLDNLADARFYKLLVESLRKNSIHKISDLSKLTRKKALSLQGIKPPGNVKSIKNALRIFETSWRRKMKSKKPTVQSNSPPIGEVKKTDLASIVLDTSPEKVQNTLSLEYIPNHSSPPRADDLTPFLDSENENLVKPASPQKHCDAPSSDAMIEEIEKAEEAVIPEVLEVADEKLDHTHSAGISQEERREEPLESSEELDKCKDKIGNKAKKDPNKRRNGLKRGRSAPHKTKGSQRKRLCNAVPPMTETPMEPASKDVEHLDNAIDSPPLESIESCEIVTQDAVETELSAGVETELTAVVETELTAVVETELTTHSPSNEDMQLVATEHMNVINKAYEDISKIVPNLRSDDAEAIQFLRLNMSNQIQKAAAILAGLSTS